MSFIFPEHRALSGAAFSILFIASHAHAELHFNINALNLSEEQKQQMDLRLLSRTDIQMPGEYEVTVRVNGSNTGIYRLNFIECDNTLCPELTLAILRQVGVKVAVIPGLKDLEADTVIIRPGDYIPDAGADFNFDNATLNLSIPQAAMDNNARGYIPPEQWDDGLPMLFTSYSASGAETRNRRTGEHESSQYLNLRSGANLGPWRLRNTSYYQRNNNGSEWNALQTWLERDIRSLRARMVAGETNSPGLVYDSFNFRGISLSTDDSMLPDSMQGYAPQITGVAVTNATVEVRQNGNLLYQTFVSPGSLLLMICMPLLPPVTLRSQSERRTVAYVPGRSHLHHRRYPFVRVPLNTQQPQEHSAPVTTTGKTRWHNALGRQSLYMVYSVKPPFMPV